MESSSDLDASSLAPTMQPSTPISHPATSGLDTTKSDTWASSLLTSIRGLFFGQSTNKETEDEAVEGWVGVRRGRGRCRSVGEVH